MLDFDVSAILEDTNTRLANEYVEAFQEYLIAVVMKNAPQTRAARLRLEEVVRESMGRAEVLGVLSTVRKAAGVLSDESAFAADRSRLVSFSNTAATKILSRVTFIESLEDLQDRVPVTLRGPVTRIADQIARLYSAAGADGRGIIAFTKAAEASVTQRAQELITSAIRRGIPEQQIGRTLAFGIDKIREETEAWTEGYARMAFRTNLNDAVSRGRIRMARDPDVKIAVPALRYTAVGDGDTRPNHEAADGVILAVDNPAWNTMRPPFGYNCRCQLDLMSRPELRRMGRLDAAGKVIESRIPSGAHPDPGFRPGATR